MEILIGATGWQHEMWQSNYYPNDLPEEWQLDYYANDFDVILIPYADWMKNDLFEDFDDLPDNFLLFFEVDNQTQQQAVKNMLLPEGVNLCQVEFPVKIQDENLSHCHICEGQVFGEAKDSNKTVLLKVYAEHVINAEEIRQIITRVQDKYTDQERVVLFYDQALVDIGILKQTQIIVDLLTA